MLDRLLNIIGRGRIRRVDEGPLQTFQVDHGPAMKDGSLDLRDAVPHAGEYGLASSPPPGCHAVVAYIGGDKGNGVAVAVADPANRPRDLMPGDSCLYDNRGRRVWLTEDGITIDAGGGAVTLINASAVTVTATTITLTGDVSVSGKLTVAGDTWMKGANNKSGASATVEVMLSDSSPATSLKAQ